MSGARNGMAQQLSATNIREHRRAVGVADSDCAFPCERTIIQTAPHTTKGVPDEYKRGEPWTTKARTKPYHRKQIPIMQLKANCFYFTALLSLFIANSVYAGPVDIVERNLAERDLSGSSDLGQYGSMECQEVH